MKFLIAFFFTIVPLKAQIFADVETTMGTFTIQFYHEESPKAVANFVSLAEGTRPWVDSTTGEIKVNQPYYDGIIFHRVIAGFVNQFGSQKGDGSDGPGYNFPDEVDNGLLHDEPYILSAANSGPHTNGSQIFITVGTPSHLDGIHTVFGIVTEGTDVVDQTNQVAVNASSRPLTDVSIVGITIRRVGEAANAFDPSAQGLPEVSDAPTTIGKETPEGPLSLLLDQPPQTSLLVTSSEDLMNWTREIRHLDGTSPAASAFSIEPLGASAFFRTAMVTWPAEATFPSSLEDNIITIDSTSGQFVIDLKEPTSLTFSGLPDTTFTIDLIRSTVTTDGYGANLLIFTIPPEGSNPLVPLRLRIGADVPITEPPTGRMTGTAFTTPSSTSLSGTFTFSERP